MSDDLEGDDFLDDNASSPSDLSGRLIDGITLPKTNDLKSVQNANEKTLLLTSDSPSPTTNAGRLVNEEEKSEGRARAEHFIKEMNAAGTYFKEPTVGSAPIDLYSKDWLFNLSFRGHISQRAGGSKTFLLVCSFLFVPQFVP